MLTADVTSDGSGLATLPLEPGLVEIPADNEALTVTAVPFTMALIADVHSFPMSLEGYFTYELDLEEVLS
jgi:hypothetical protein